MLNNIISEGGAMVEVRKFFHWAPGGEPLGEFEYVPKADYEALRAALEEIRLDYRSGSYAHERAAVALKS
jgi:hypothetical protein